MPGLMPGMCVSTHFVIAGHSASEDARERAYDPAIHPLRKKYLQRMMDPRVKPAGDACGCGMLKQTDRNVL
jgi:hypothetical protein